MSRQAKQSENTRKKKDRSIIFIHLDLGIGGAEQLIVNLASASLNTSTEYNQNLRIYTAHCDQNHCFDEVNKSKNGILADYVNVRGQFIPDELRIPFIKKCVGGRALCSSVRIIYLSFIAAIENLILERNDNELLFVVDILPTSLPLIQWMISLLSPASKNSGVLFYCHFPDKHLVRDTINGEVHASNKRSVFRSVYRWILDYIEERTMTFADVVLVNSNFTKEVVNVSFPNFQSSHSITSVLYPAINLDKFVPPVSESNIDSTLEIGPIVSLNRFERKKNIELLLHAISELKINLPHELHDKLKVVIAGGYEEKNDENKQYLVELKTITHDLNIDGHVTFAPSVSDSERATLLQTSLCVCYTPHREHFGIVPLEAMYAGSPVIAVNSGGPKETVVDCVTGRLVMNSPYAFAGAIYEMIVDPKKAREMGRRGHERVKNRFGMDRFRSEWLAVIDDTLITSKGNTKAMRVRTQNIFLALNACLILSAIIGYMILHS